MLRCTAAVLLLVLLASGCSESAEPMTGSSAREAASAAAASTRSNWHTIEYGPIALDVPANWALNGDDPCTGQAIVSPPRVRTSCPPLPSALISTTADDASAPNNSAAAVVVDGFLVRLSGVDEKTAQAILASVRTR